MAENLMQEKVAERYREAIEKTAGMVRDPKVQNMVSGKHFLNIVNVTWEDTGRYKGSCVGPNISDMTIQVANEGKLTCMPVIRAPNFSDVTGDVPLDKFFVLVGNEKGEQLRKVCLRDVLADLRKFLTKPESWKGEKTSLLSDRDTHVLASAQACFLPVPFTGLAKFNPVLFNYQSYEDNPAVLTILATREGTSVTVIDNKRDAFEEGGTWGQRLFFNNNGERASMTAQRKTDFVAAVTAEKGAEAGKAAAEQEGLNMVLLIQVPLKQKERPRATKGMFTSGLEGVVLCACACTRGIEMDYCEEDSDVEEAVIGHGEVEGPFTEIGDLAIERDDRFPIRVTVQFYKATSNGVVSEADISQIAEQIQTVYNNAEYVGSLVVEDSDRPTEYDGDKTEPPGWWADFWERHQKNTGQTPEDTIAMLEKLLGKSISAVTEPEAEAALTR